MPLADCPVAAMARDFAVTIATINELDDKVGQMISIDDPEYTRAWDRLYDLQDEALAKVATSETGLALQLALAFDELTKLETIDFTHSEREASFRNLRRIVRSAMLTMDPRIAGRVGLIEMFVGHAAAEQFKRQNVAPKPS